MKDSAGVVRRIAPLISYMPQNSNVKMNRGGGVR